jgi:putative ABC transport system permease protein
MFKLILSNLKQRPTRTVISVLAVALGVALILVSVGLSYGQLNDFSARMRLLGDVMVQPSDGSLFFAINSGTISVRIGEKIAEVEGVAAVTPILTKFLGEQFHLVFGIEKATFQDVSRSFRIVRGQLLGGPDEIIIDTAYSDSEKLDLGDRLELLGTSFRVIGIFEEGVGARVLMPLQTLQNMNGTPGKATMFFVRASDETTDLEVADRLQERLKGYKITRTSEIQMLMTSNIPVLKPFITAMVSLSALISFMMILLAMYSTILERTREIGILKSLGASKSFILSLILKESLVICGIGVGAGFLLTWLAIHVILSVNPNLPVDISGSWKLGAALMAFLGGTLGALYPALKAAHLDPIKALGYE